MAANPNIDIPRLTWIELVSELRRRGAGRRESGAFLLGKTGVSDGRVVAFVCYDDLDPKALLSGAVTFHGDGLVALWALCAKQGMQVLADVHTHPTENVRQSRIDRENPMIPVAGHIALILPSYGYASKWSLKGVGQYLFQGNGRWETFEHNHPMAPARLCIW